MKVINVPITYVFVSTLGKNASNKKNIRQIDIARKSASLVVTSSLSIESCIKEILMNTLFSEVEQKAEMVSGLILNSDWCTFSSLRKLLNEVLIAENLLNGKDRNELDKLLSKVMRYRNAFTHGEIIFEDEKIYLKYFEGTSRSVVLDNEYLEKVELVITSAFEIVDELLNKIIKKNKK